MKIVKSTVYHIIYIGIWVDLHFDFNSLWNESLIYHTGNIFGLVNVLFIEWLLAQDWPFWNFISVNVFIKLDVKYPTLISNATQIMS